MADVTHIDYTRFDLIGGDMDIAAVEVKLIETKAGKRHYKDMRTFEDRLADALVMAEYSERYAISTAEHLRKIKSEINVCIGKIDIITPLENEMPVLK